jgi:nitroimidazol reductase NimA-like FMN-containing flavoprotein (pyridoxamine 5'-phosphate oxidase superfamily)
VAHPLNFVVDEDDIVVSTTDSHATAITGHGRVSFEVDRVDEVMSEGWSVLVTGTARRVENLSELEALGRLGLAPWASGSRHELVRIHPDVVTGRVISQELTPLGSPR